MAQKTVKWLNQLAEDDYEAARTYLSIIYQENDATKYTKRIQRAKVSKYRAEDILRASELSVLPTSDKGVKKNRKKIGSGKKLSPILLVRDPNRDKVIIADGYHRLCAANCYDCETLIPCKII